MTTSKTLPSVLTGQSRIKIKKPRTRTVVRIERHLKRFKTRYGIAVEVFQVKEDLPPMLKRAVWVLIGKIFISIGVGLITGDLNEDNCEDLESILMEADDGLKLLFKN